MLWRASGKNDDRTCLLCTTKNRTNEIRPHQSSSEPCRRPSLHLCPLFFLSHPVQLAINGIQINQHTNNTHGNQTLSHHANTRLPPLASSQHNNIHVSKSNIPKPFDESPPIISDIRSGHTHAAPKTPFLNIYKRRYSVD